MHAMLFALLSGGSPIDLDASFLIQSVLFWIAFFALRSLVFQPVMKLIDAREKAIEGARAEARDIEASAKGKADAFDDEMRRVKAAASSERERLRQEGVTLERSILDKVRKETQDMVTAKSADLADEATQARQRIAGEVPMLARAIATKLLGREVG